MTVRPLDLEGVAPFAGGGTRQCFVHPDDPTLCVKVDRGGVSFTGDEERHMRRVQYLRRGRPFEACTAYGGRVETSRGTGRVYELVRDARSGRISQPLATYLRLPRDDGRDRLLCDAFERFRAAILRDGVAWRDPNTYNLCVQGRADGSFRLVAVDGFGHRQFLPIADIVPMFARRTTLRRMERNGFTDLATLRALDAQNPRIWVPGESLARGLSQDGSQTSPRPRGGSDMEAIE